MGTIIKSSAICSNGTHSSIELTVRAGERCVEAAGVDKKDITLLIYTGVYRDDNIAEPAIAPLVQRKLGLNTDPVQKGTLDNVTFSFDINNGVCGFLSAVSVANATLACGAARYALVLAGDVHPSKQYHPEFPYTNIGSAVLLEYTGEKDRGFRDITFKSKGGSLGLVSMVPFTDLGTQGRNATSFKKEEDYHGLLRKAAVESIREYLASGKLDISEVDYLLPSQQYKGFGREISDSIGLNGRSRVVDLFDRYGDPHTSALPLSFHHLLSEGKLKENDKLLFVAAGAGPTGACSLYVA